MRITIRLTPDQTDALRETARREDRSMQEVAREAISLYVMQRTQRRDEHIAKIIAEDAALLRRLGST
jgi:predicted transcriptional regulator